MNGVRAVPGPCTIPTTRSELETEPLTEANSSTSASVQRHRAHPRGQGDARLGDVRANPGGHLLRLADVETHLGPPLGSLVLPCCPTLCEDITSTRTTRPERSPCVPIPGVEPGRGYPHTLLRRARLPIPPHGPTSYGGRRRVTGTPAPTVGLTGFEPATTRSQSGCATKLRHNPSPAVLQGRTAPPRHLFVAPPGRFGGGVRDTAPQPVNVSAFTARRPSRGTSAVPHPRSYSPRDSNPHAPQWGTGTSSLRVYHSARRASNHHSGPSRRRRTTFGWSGWQDSNLRPSGPQPDALPNCATTREPRTTAGTTMTKCHRPY